MKGLSKLFLPDICCICGEITDGSIYFNTERFKIKSPFCASCTAQLENSFRCVKRNIKGIGAHAVYLFSFSNETTEKAIYHIKIRECAASNEFFASLARCVLEELCGNDTLCVTNVPRSISLLQKYGFDQSEAVTRTLVRDGEPFYYKKLLCRNKRFKKPQRYLNAKERLANARASLMLFDRNMPDTVVVIDDMITTGATAKATYELLTSAGCGKIYFLFLAGKEITKERRKENE